MTKPATSYNNLDLWREYCARLAEYPIPNTVLESFRIATPDLYEKSKALSERLGVDDPGLPYDGDRNAETRVPIARAITAIRTSKRVKKDETKLRHLETALTWLECQHPWQGVRTEAEINAMVVEIQRAIDDPGISLDHLLDRCFYYRFHPKIELSQQVQPIAKAPRAGPLAALTEKPSILKLAFKRLFCFKEF